MIHNVFFLLILLIAAMEKTLTHLSTMQTHATNYLMLNRIKTLSNWSKYYLRSGEKCR